MTNSVAQILQELVKAPSLLAELYGDLAKPGVRQVGIALESVLGLGNTILWPLALLNERSRILLQRNMEKYRQRLANTPIEHVVRVAPEVGVPVAEKLAYVLDDQLSELYVSLLASASAADTVHRAHPAFTHVINCLTPDEAALLRSFRGNQALSFARGRWVCPPDGSRVDASDYLLEERVVVDLAYRGNVPAYLSNLSGLGLIEIRETERAIDSHVYEAIEDIHRDRIDDSKRRPPNSKLVFDRGLIFRTQFGFKFAQACGVE